MIFRAFATFSRISSEEAGKSAGSTFGSALQTGAKLAAGAIAGATGAATAFSAESVKVGSAFDSAMSQVAATTGSTTDEIKGLRDFALEMGSTTAFSATQAAEALNYTSLAGYTAEESMAALPGILNLAAAGNIDLASASDMVTDAQSALGLSMEGSAELIDMMAMASSKSNTSIAQLGSAILTVGGTAKNLSGGTNELNTALGILADNGIKGAEGGTALRNMILSLSAPTDKASKLMNDLGVSALDADGNFRPLNDIFTDFNDVLSGMTQGEQTQALSTIFNKVDLKSVSAMLSAASQEVEGVGNRFDELSGYIDTAAGSAQQMADVQLDNLSGDITLLQSAFEGVQIAVSDELTPSLREFTQFGTESLTRLNEAFKSDGLSGAMSELGNIISDGLSMVIEKLPEFIDAGTQLLGSLVQGIVENLPKLVEAALEIITTLASGIGESLPELIPTIVDVVLQIVETLTDPETLAGLVDAALSIITGLADGLIEAIPVIVERLPQIIENVVSGLLECIPEIIEAGIQLFSALVENLPEIIEAIVTVLPEIIAGIVSAITENLPDIIAAGVDLFVALVENLPEIIAGIVGAIPEIISAILEGIAPLGEELASFFSDVWDTIVEAWNDVVEFFGDLFQKAWEAIKSAWDGVSEFFSDIWEGIKGVWDGVVEFFGDLFSDAWDAITDVWDTVTDWFSDLWDSIVEVFGEVVEFFGNLFSDAWDAIVEIWEAATGWFSDLWDSISDVFSGVVDFFGGVFSDAWDAIVDVWEKVTGWFSDLWDSVMDVFSDVVDFFGDLFSDAWDAIVDVWEAATDWFSDLWDSITEVFSKVVDFFGDLFSDAWDAIVEVWETVAEWFQGVWDDICDVFENAGEWFSEKFTEAKEKALSAWDNIKEKFGEVWNNVKSAFKIEDALQWGRDLIDNFIGGIREKFASLRETVSNAAQIVKDFLGFSEPKKGPLSNFHTYAPDMMALFANGIRDNEQIVKSQIERSFAFDPVSIDYVLGSSTLPSSPVMTYGHAEANGEFISTINGIADNIIRAIREIEPSISIGDETIGHSYERYQEKRGVHVNRGAFANAY